MTQDPGSGNKSMSQHPSSHSELITAWVNELSKTGKGSHGV